VLLKFSIDPAPKYFRSAISLRSLRSLDRHDLFVTRARTSIAQTQSLALRFGKTPSFYAIHFINWWAKCLFSFSQGWRSFRRRSFRRVHFVAFISSQNHFVATHFVADHFVAFISSHSFRRKIISSPLISSPIISSPIISSPIISLHSFRCVYFVANYLVADQQIRNVILADKLLQSPGEPSQLHREHKQRIPSM